MCEIKHKIELSNKKGGWCCIKNTEEIRRDLGISQVDFCNMIGTSLRTYHGRFDGTQPEWKLNELIEIAKHNDGEVRVDLKDGSYEVTIREI